MNSKYSSLLLSKFFLSLFFFIITIGFTHLVVISKQLKNKKSTTETK
jgi:putative copper export protein